MLSRVTLIADGDQEVEIFKAVKEDAKIVGRELNKVKGLKTTASTSIALVLIAAVQAKESGHITRDGFLELSARMWDSVKREVN